MQDTGLFDKWTLQGLLDELDIIELFEVPGQGRVLGEITEKQTTSKYPVDKLCIYVHKYLINIGIVWFCTSYVDFLFHWG